MQFTFLDLVLDLQTLIANRLNDETICLFTGDSTPGPGDTTFTYLAREGNFGGYQRLPLTFTPASLNSDSVAITQSQIAGWLADSTINCPQTITGVFALDSEGNVAWADLLPYGPITINGPGGQVWYQAFIELPS